MADRIIVLYGGEIMEQGRHRPDPPRAAARVHEAAHGGGAPAAARERTGSRSGIQPAAAGAVASGRPTAGYGGVKGGKPGVQILFDVDVDIPRGQAVGVIGESGCGKSTMARVISGLTPSFEGEVRLDGKALPPDVKHRDKEGPAARSARAADARRLLQSEEARGAGPRPPARVLPEHERRGTRPAGRGAAEHGGAAGGLRPDASRTSCPAGRSSASTSPARWRRSPTSSCATR